MIGPSYKIARVFGIPIRVHISLLVILPLLAWRASAYLGLSPGAGLLYAISLFVFVALHELGHSFVAIKTGARVREITLMFIGGAAQLESVPKRPRDEFLMALAGPLVSLALFALLLWLGFALPLTAGSVRVEWGEGSFRPNMLHLMAFLNAMLAIFNLLPAFPMDGGRLVRAALSPRLGRLQATRIAANIGKGICVFLAILGVWYTHNWFLIVIAFFIFTAADREYRIVCAQEQPAGHEQARQPEWDFR